MKMKRKSNLSLVYLKLSVPVACANERVCVQEHGTNKPKMQKKTAEAATTTIIIINSHNYVRQTDDSHLESSESAIVAAIDHRKMLSSPSPHYMAYLTYDALHK